MEADLRALVQEIQAQLPAGTVSAADHSVAAGRDVNITASGGGVAAGVIHGNVAPPDPTGRARRAASRARVAGLQGRVQSSPTAAGWRSATVVYQRPAVAGQPVRLAPRPVLLAGREELLAELDARLSAGDGPGPRVVVVVRAGGRGQDQRGGGVRAPSPGRSRAGLAVPRRGPAVLAAGFGELAAQLGARDLLDARDPVASVHAVLAAPRPGGCWCSTMRRTGPRSSRSCPRPGTAGC